MATGGPVRTWGGGQVDHGLWGGGGGGGGVDSWSWASGGADPHPPPGGGYSMAWAAGWPRRGPWGRRGRPRSLRGQGSPAAGDEKASPQASSMRGQASRRRLRVGSPRMDLMKAPDHVVLLVGPRSGRHAGDGRSRAGSSRVMVDRPFLGRQGRRPPPARWGPTGVASDRAARWKAARHRSVRAPAPRTGGDGPDPRGRSGPSMRARGRGGEASSRKSVEKGSQRDVDLEKRVLGGGAMG